MGVAALNRRRFLQGSLALTGVGLLTSCGVPALPWQQPPRVHRIGYTWNGPVSPTFTALKDAFVEGMRDLGYVEDNTFILEVRRVSNDGNMAETMAELIGLQPDVIVVPAADEARALHAQTTTIPIVSAGSGDLATYGVTTSLARPGGNVTGLSTPLLAGKHLELLKQAVPTLMRVAAILDASRVAERSGWYEAAAANLGLELQIIGIDGLAGLEAVFEAAVRGGAKAVYVVPSPFTSANQAKIAELATLNRLPAIAQQSDAASLGQLMGYGPNRVVLHRSAATYVDKILKGAKPGDLPIEQPTVYDFGINLKTAAMLGLTIPPSVLAQATVIVQ
jgi:putative tryptophan/tyrosine transport system substrate-binding protein